MQAIASQTAPPATNALRTITELKRDTLGNLIGLIFNSKPIRVQRIDGETIFVVSDVRKGLLLGPAAVTFWKAQFSSTELPKYVRNIIVIPDGPSMTYSRKQLGVTEAGLYQLVLQSRKPAAQALRAWLTDVVLPSIRKTGSFHEDPTKQARSDEDHLITEARFHLQAKYIVRVQRENCRLALLTGQPVAAPPAVAAPPVPAHPSAAFAVYRPAYTQTQLMERFAVNRSKLKRALHKTGLTDEEGCPTRAAAGLYTREARSWTSESANGTKSSGTHDNLVVWYDEALELIKEWLAR